MREFPLSSHHKNIGIYKLQASEANTILVLYVTRITSISTTKVNSVQKLKLYWMQSIEQFLLNVYNFSKYYNIVLLHCRALPLSYNLAEINTADCTSIISSLWFILSKSWYRLHNLGAWDTMKSEQDHRMFCCKNFIKKNKAFILHIETKFASVRQNIFTQRCGYKLFH